MGCPNCGTPYNPTSRNCTNCGFALFPTSFVQTFGYDLEGHEVIVSLEKWRQHLKLEPDNVNAHFALGIIYLNLQYRDSALEHFRRASTLLPKAADIHYDLAVTLFNDGNLGLDSPEYAELIKEVEYSARLLPELKEASAFNHLINAIKLESVNSAQALAEYRNAVEDCPDVPIIWNNMGICLYKINNLEEAYKCFQKAITLSPELAIAYSNLAYIMYKYSSYVQGVEMGAKALSLMGPAEARIHLADAHNVLALCLWKLNRRTEALEHSKMAVAIAPNVQTYRQNLKLIEGKGCFIVTATLGDQSHPWTIELCAFRDQILYQSRIGRGLIYFYYRTSPFLAGLISSSRLLRRLSRIFIVVPAIFFARLWSKMYLARISSDK